MGLYVIVDTMSFWLPYVQHFENSEHSCISHHHSHLGRRECVVFLLPHVLPRTGLDILTSE